MATIRSYTDLEQSKKLVKILSLESADMKYISFRHNDDTIEWIPQLGTPSKYDIPCWSLAALLDVLPKPDLVQNSEGTWLIRSWVNAYPWSVGGYSNHVDACVEMIERLHGLNLL